MANDSTMKWTAFTVLLVTCWLHTGQVAHAQSGDSSAAGPVPCVVQYLRLRIATGGDDLRGWNGVSTSKDNLNVTIHFGDESSQVTPNVNHNKPWPNNSVNTVEIKLNRAVPINAIKSITLDHGGTTALAISAPEALTPAGPAAGLQTPDNWDMQYLEVTAVGDGVGAIIIRHGPKRFTGHDRILQIRADIPANSCAMRERFGRLNAGTEELRPTSGAVAKYGTETSSRPAIQPAPGKGSQQWQNNRIVSHALAHTVEIGPRAAIPAGLADGSYSTLVGLLRRQSLVASSLMSAGTAAAAKSPGSSASSAGQATVLPRAAGERTMLSSGSPPQVGISRAMSASGAQNPLRNAAPVADHMCVAGISSVDGQKSGIWFSPLPGPEGTFVIQGCGFGMGGGVVYLSGLHTAPQVLTATQAFAATNAPSSGEQTPLPPEDQAAAGGVIGSVAQQQLLGSPRPDRILFQISQWTDQRIVVQIDPHARGFYDTNDVTLVVKTTGGQQYQAGAFNFSAARETQSLTAILNPSIGSGIHLAKVADSFGEPVSAIPESPSVSFLQNHTIAVMRNRIAASLSAGASFAGGTDTYQFKFAPGFQIAPHDGVQLYTADASASDCQLVNGQFSKSGNWAVNYTSTSSFDISWEEEACLPSGSGRSPLNFGSVSAYALEITVTGPRGVSPWPAGNLTTITTQRPNQWLQNH
jgi:hypothetical protein